MAFPHADFVDGESAMKAARRIKTADELRVLRGALAVAERGLAAALSGLTAGITEQALNGVLMEAMAAGGFSTSATQDGVWITSREYSWRVGRRDGRIGEGDLVALAAGALADGYVGEVGRTWPVGEVNGAETLFRRSDDLWERLVGACRPGASAGDLLAAYDAAGEALPPIPVAHGLGLGFDPPVVSPDLPATTAAERLDPGTVLALTAYVWQEGVGAVFHRDAVLITDNGAEVLTSSPSYSGTAIGAVNL
jgi:Xaa-Pro aminopeptidase